jgi:hypothetical protein
MNDLIKTKDSGNFLAYLEKDGRLNYEFGANKKNTLAQIASDIHKAALVMGISVDGEKSVLTASEALKKILEVYPTAWVKDVSKAIEMASFGQIKLENQLNTISAANIFQWYRELRINHPDKIGIPYLKNHQTQEMSGEQKYQLAIEGFKRLLTVYKTDEIGQMVYYNRFQKMGLLELSKESKIQRTTEEIDKLLARIPVDILTDRLKRKKAHEFRDYYNELAEPKKVNWAMWSENPIVQTAISNLQRKLVIELLDFCDHEELFEDYKKHIANEYEVAS